MNEAPFSGHHRVREFSANYVERDEPLIDLMYVIVNLVISTMTCGRGRLGKFDKVQVIVGDVRGHVRRTLIPVHLETPRHFFASTLSFSISGVLTGFAGYPFAHYAVVDYGLKNS